MNPSHKWFGRITLGTLLLAFIAWNAGCHDDDKSEDGSAAPLTKQGSGGDDSARQELVSLRQENQTLKQLADGYRRQAEQLRLENDQLRAQTVLQRAASEAALRRPPEPAGRELPAITGPTVLTPQPTQPGLVVPPPGRTADRPPVSVYDPPDPAPFVPAASGATSPQGKPATQPSGRP